MTEQEYIYVRDLSNVLAADRLLRDMNEKHNGLPETEYFEVIRTLGRWREHLFTMVETNEPIA
jgi:hypothetical protein